MITKGSKTYKGATISGCPVDKRSWHFYSTTFKTEKDAYFGDAWNDVLFLGKVPVFYTPYAQIPLTKKRHSGLLPVSLEYKSGEGISYSAPIYLNLATNYDATVTPGHDAKRGNIYDVQFRYLPFNNLQVRLTLPICQTILTGHQRTMTTAAGLLTFIRPYLS